MSQSDTHQVTMSGRSRMSLDLVIKLGGGILSLLISLIVAMLWNMKGTLDETKTTGDKTVIEVGELRSDVREIKAYQQETASKDYVQSQNRAIQALFEAELQKLRSQYEAHLSHPHQNVAELISGLRERVSLLEAKNK